MSQAKMSGLSRRSSAYAVSHCSVVAGLLMAAATTPSQSAKPHSIPPYATVDLLPGNAITVALTPRPPTPSDKLRSPFPPEKPGCFHLVDKIWQEVHCLTDEEMKKHPPALPLVANAIQSTPHRGIDFVLDDPCCHVVSATITSPFVWGSVAATQDSSPATATETDSMAGTNTFSIQANTNWFECSTCRAGYPFAATPGVANSASQPRDTAEVQFVYEQEGSGPDAYSYLCIFNDDVTIARNTSQTAGYKRHCMSPNSTATVLPLDGMGAPSSTAEVIGYIQCLGPNYRGCFLWVVADLPWVPGPGGNEWYALATPDLMGLAGRWTNLSGGILGYGGGSTAQFTDSRFDTLLHAYSCYSSPSSADGYELIPCAYPSPQNSYLAQYFELTASPAINSTSTAETNNLNTMMGPVVFSCGDYDCWMLVNAASSQ
ncbi:MAG: hypothetical protein ABR912_13020 [Terracidiphilus sp.]|jgi:hypothetical protein